MNAVGMHLTVFSGRPVWPLALHQLVMAVDRRVFLERRLEWVNFSGVPLRPGSGGGQFIGEVKRGYKVDWSDCHVLPDQADCVLAARGLLHMQVKCVIPEELDGDYEPEVSGMCAFTCSKSRPGLSLNCSVSRCSGGGWMRLWWNCLLVIPRQTASMRIQWMRSALPSATRSTVQMRRRQRSGCMAVVTRSASSPARVLVAGSCQLSCMLVLTMVT